MTDVVIVSAVRTAIGAFGGALSGLSASEIGQIVIRDSLDRANLKAADVSEVVMGQVLTSGTGQNPARQASIGAGVPNEVPALTINQVCGSGLKAVALGHSSILAGADSVVVAGGQESMSNAPHCLHMRNGTKMGDVSLIDTLIRDGLWDAFYGYHMGVTAENVAEQWQVTRDAQDAFAAESQCRVEKALADGRFKDEIVPVKVKVKREERLFDQDEHPRGGTTTEKLGKLKPAFNKTGTVTAGNASGINDGAAAVVLMSAAEAKSRNLRPLVRIVSWAQSGVDPALMGVGPIPASRTALEKAGWGADDLDLIEVNEAFAAQSIAVCQDLGFDTARVNVNGGAIALGHPIGASGCRVLVTLIHEMHRRSAKKGLVTLCIGGGMGIAMCVERK